MKMFLNLASSQSPKISCEPSASLATQIPEILIQIFSHLSQPDLIYTISPVNRLWNSISANLIHGTLLWKDTSSLQDQEKSLGRLASIQVKTFQCVAQDKRTYASFDPEVSQRVEAAWVRLASAIEAIATANSALDPIGSQAGKGLVTFRGEYKILPWKRIIFKECNCFNERWDRLLEHHPGSFYGLSSIQFKHMTPGVLDLSLILSTLVNLEELSIQSIESSPYSFKRNLTITWDEKFKQLEGAHGIGKPSQGKSIQAMKLRTFNLRHIIINQDTLEMILSGMPYLRSLKLRFLIAARHNPASARIDRTSFIEFLASQYPNLVELHFSISREPVSSTETRQVLDALPNIKSLSILGRGIQLGISSILADRLTSLEIETDDFYNVAGAGHGHTLHSYLCQAPCLLHLKALKTRLLQSFFILELAPGAEAREPHDAFSKPIWACRGLKTLHILLDSPGGYATHEQNDQNRRVYGYLSRVCPNVEDMVLDWSYFHFNITSGLVLLTRCKKLKYLHIFSGITPCITPRDLDWLSLGMIDNSNNPEAQDLRYLIERDGILGALSRRFSSSWRSEPGIGGISKTERETWIQWMIDTLKRKFLEEQHPDEIIHRIKNMDGQEMEGIDPQEMISLNSMEPLLKHLHVLLERSRKSSRSENMVCCWPNLEVFAINMESHSFYSQPWKYIIWKLRPELRRYYISSM